MSKIFDPGKGARRQQTRDISGQRQVEAARLAEEESEVARRKALASRSAGGRQSLIATSRTGVTGQATTLGGS